MKLSRLTFISLISIVFVGNAQDIHGKWMKIRIPNDISYPNINIIEINNDSIFSYNFDKLYAKEKIKTSDSTLILMDSLVVNFTFKGNNVIELNSSNKETQNDTPVRYVRLLSTKDEFNLIDALHATSYAVHLKQDYFVFKLGEKKNTENAITTNFPKMAVDMVCIDKFKDTYFLCFYLLEKLHYVFPIKNITESKMIIYGVPFHDGEIILDKKG